MHYVVGVFWLLPPPYLRWLAAALVFVTIGGIELAGRASEPYPFTATALTRGAPLADAVVWRDVPRGLLPAPGDTTGFAARRLERGEPITTTAVRSDDGVPDGWWSIPVVLPEAAAAGTEVRLISVDAGVDVTGIVVAESASGAFATSSPGLVAVPAASAGPVAAAAAADQLTVLIRT